MSERSRANFGSQGLLRGDHRVSKDLSHEAPSACSSASVDQVPAKQEAECASVSECLPWANFGSQGLLREDHRVEHDLSHEASATCSSASVNRVPAKQGAECASVIEFFC